MSSFNRSRLFPFRDLNQHDQTSLYSLNGTGLAGQLVKIVTGSANPQSTEVDGFGSSTVGGVSYNGTFSNRYENFWKVTPTTSGDNRYDAVGVTLHSTVDTDENGLPIRYYPERAKQIGAVASGETITVARAGFLGVWGNYIDTSLGAPQPGHLAVVSRSGNGLFAAVDPDNASNFRAGAGATPGPTGTQAAWMYDPRHVVGKWLSSLPTSSNTGIGNEFSAQLGYAFLHLDVTQ